jgi:hypothetical protein
VSFSRERVGSAIAMYRCLLLFSHLNKYVRLSKYSFAGGAESGCKDVVEVPVIETRTRIGHQNLF